jgi:hypothetical protein
MVKGKSPWCPQTLWHAFRRLVALLGEWVLETASKAHHPLSRWSQRVMLMNAMTRTPCNPAQKKYIGVMIKARGESDKNALFEVCQ